MNADNVKIEVMEEPIDETIYEDLTPEEKALILTEVWIEYPDKADLVKKELGFGWKIVT